MTIIWLFFIYFLFRLPNQASCKLVSYKRVYIMKKNSISADNISGDLLAAKQNAQLKSWSKP